MIPSQPTVADAQSHRHQPPPVASDGESIRRSSLSLSGEREISNDACWWSQWFKQWEQLWRLSVLAASSRCFRMNASAGVTLGLLTLLPPQAVYSVTWLSSCVFHQVSHLHLDVTIASGERGVTAGVIWVHMNIGYTSRNPTPHCVISRHKNSRQIFSISPPSKYFTLKIFFRSPPHIPLTDNKWWYGQISSISLKWGPGAVNFYRKFTHYLQQTWNQIISGPPASRFINFEFDSNIICCEKYLRLWFGVW